MATEVLSPRGAGWWGTTRESLLAGGIRSGVVVNLLLSAAAGTIAVSAAVHLHLWSTGYRQIPTIGPLFLFQAVCGFAVAATVLAIRRVWAAAIAFVFTCATIGGFLLACTVGLFGFRDAWNAPFAGMAFGYEVAALVLLATGSVWAVARQRAQDVARQRAQGRSFP